MTHPRIEAPDLTNFVTTRTRHSELWFVNNKPLEADILGHLAKFSNRYSVPIYAFALSGSHPHLLGDFPNSNRSFFMRDFNSSIPYSVKKHCKNYKGGSLFSRRYSNEFVPGEADIEEKFFYTVLQQVQDGIVEKISDYPGYNCFHDAVYGIKREFFFTDWARFNSDRRYNSRIRIKDYRYKVILEYTRLPGYEDMSQRDYAIMMHKKLEERRVEIVAKRKAEGKGFLGLSKLREIIPGTPAKNPKKSTRDSFRPRILCVCPKRRAEYYDWYFYIYFAYKEASQRYRDGELNIEFPPGTYKPQLRLITK